MRVWSTAIVAVLMLVVAASAGSQQLLLRTYQFDPLLGEPWIAPELQAAEPQPGETGYYLVQLTGPIYEHQKAALDAIYRQVGFARSLLAYEMPDGRLKLIDGHLRRDLDPEMEVDVEILDVNDEEARALLLSIDPLAALAQTQEQIHQRLMELTPAESPELEAAWQAAMKE